MSKNTRSSSVKHMLKKRERKRCRWEKKKNRKKKRRKWCRGKKRRRRKKKKREDGAQGPVVRWE